MTQPTRRHESYGERGLSWLDRLGASLSRARVHQSLKRLANPAVLEIGCGFDATLLREMSPRISRGVGIDLTINPLATETKNLSFIASPVEEALEPLADQRFDVIMLISVLEHLAEAQAVLGSCFKLLNAGGELLINVPTWRGKPFLEFSAFCLGLSPAIEMDDHKMYYSKRDLWPMLVKAGFKPSQIKLRYHKLGMNLFAVARKGQGLSDPAIP